MNDRRKSEETKHRLKELEELKAKGIVKKEDSGKKHEEDAVIDEISPYAEYPYAQYPYEIDEENNIFEKYSERERKIKLEDSEEDESELKALGMKKISPNEKDPHEEDPEEIAEQKKKGLGKYFITYIEKNIVNLIALVLGTIFSILGIVSKTPVITGIAFVVMAAANFYFLYKINNQIKDLQKNIIEARNKTGIDDENRLIEDHPEISLMREEFFSIGGISLVNISFLASGIAAVVTGSLGWYILAFFLSGVLIPVLNNYLEEKKSALNKKCGMLEGWKEFRDNSEEDIHPEELLSGEREKLVEIINELSRAYNELFKEHTQLKKQTTRLPILDEEYKKEIEMIHIHKSNLNSDSQSEIILKEADSPSAEHSSKQQKLPGDIDRNRLITISDIPHHPDSQINLSIPEKK